MTHNKIDMLGMNQTTPQVETGTKTIFTYRVFDPFMLVGILGIVISIASILLIYKTYRNIMLYGAMDMGSMVMHSSIMFIGMILFVISDRKFTTLRR